MRYLFITLFLISTNAKAQDTIHVFCTQDQAIKALVEKGFALDFKAPGKLITKAFETKRFGVAGHNELLLRLTIISESGECKIIGDYASRNAHSHSHGKSWIPIYNKKKNAKTWGIMNDFAEYLKSELVGK